MPPRAALLARGLRGALLLGLALLPACRTNIALIDATYGEEVRHAGHIVHLRSARTPIEATASGYRFVLDVVFENATSEAWTVLVSDFALRWQNGDADTELTPALDLPADAVLLTVPAVDGVDVRLPIRIEAASHITVTALERRPLELTMQQDGRTLLRRRVVAGSYSQLGQAARVVFLATLGLVLLSLL
ncbi:MAG: hypothetical protein R3F56_17915 [Planctomycetota bacterium]